MFAVLHYEFLVSVLGLTLIVYLGMLLKAYIMNNFMNVLGSFVCILQKSNEKIIKSMEKGHIMEIAKMEKGYMREVTKKLTDMWLKLNPDSEKECKKHNTALIAYCPSWRVERSALAHF